MQDQATDGGYRIRFHVRGGKSVEADSWTALGALITQIHSEAIVECTEANRITLQQLRDQVARLTIERDRAQEKFAFAAPDISKELAEAREQIRRLQTTIRDQDKTRREMAARSRDVNALTHDLEVARDSHTETLRKLDRAKDTIERLRRARRGETRRGKTDQRHTRADGRKARPAGAKRRRS